jgi:lipid-binding SYLF domain-containing protein
MKKLLFVVVALLSTQLSFAVEDIKEVDRIKDAGTVLKEILNIPDDIPKDLLDRAECVIVLPSVKKLAIGIGGSYGRGVMICRTGEHYTGGWGAPAMRFFPTPAPVVCLQGYRWKGLPCVRTMALTKSSMDTN